MGSRWKFSFVALLALVVAASCIQKDNSTLAEVEIGNTGIDHVEKTEGESDNDAESDSEAESDSAEPMIFTDGVPDIGEGDGEAYESESVPFGTSDLTTEHLKLLHTKMDVDHDGKVSLTEAMWFWHNMQVAAATKADIPAIIDEIDLNKDGKLVLAEVLSPLEHQDGLDEEGKAEVDKSRVSQTALFKAADSNGDGSLEGDELRLFYFPETNDDMLKSASLANLKSKDTNGDGRLTNLEFLEVQGGAATIEGDGSIGTKVSLTEEDTALFAELDIDGNGSLDVEEFQAWESGSLLAERDMKKLFQLADRDKDSMLTAEELEGDQAEIAESEVEPRLFQWVMNSEL